MSDDKYFEFGDFWFIRGGMLHGLWKRKQYTAIKDLAYDLPKAAWDARQHEIDALKADVTDLSKKFVDMKTACECEEIKNQRLQTINDDLRKEIQDLKTAVTTKTTYVPNDEEKT